MGVDYSQASVCFPEWFKKLKLKLEKNSGSTSGPDVLFTRNGFLIYAKIKPEQCMYFGDPNDRTIQSEIIQSEIIQPTIRKVVADIQTIDDLFDELRTLTRKGKVDASFCYDKDQGGFKVYDYSMSSKNLKDKLFKIIVDTPEQELKRIGQKACDLVRHINQEGEQLHYVKGSTLREATQRALAIYQIADKLKTAKV